MLSAAKTAISAVPASMTAPSAIVIAPALSASASAVTVTLPVQLPTVTLAVIQISLPPSNWMVPLTVVTFPSRLRSVWAFKAMVPAPLVVSAPVVEMLLLFAVNDRLLSALSEILATVRVPP